MPSFFGKSKKQQQLMDDLPSEFNRIATKFKVAPGDFPNITKFKKILQDFDLSKFPKNNTKLIAKIDSVLSQDIPTLMSQIRHPHLDNEDQLALANPFANTSAVGILQGNNNSDWLIQAADKSNYDNQFYGAELVNGKLSGANAKDILAASGLSNQILFKIWQLADIEGDGTLDCDEFAVAMHLINETKKGSPVPDLLPPNLLPPSKR